MVGGTWPGDTTGENAALTALGDVRIGGPVKVELHHFPLADRNPQTFVDIYRAKASDYRPAWMRIDHEAGRESRVTVGILPR